MSAEQTDHNFSLPAVSSSQTAVLTAVSDSLWCSPMGRRGRVLVAPKCPRTERKPDTSKRRPIGEHQRLSDIPAGVAGVPCLEYQSRSPEGVLATCDFVGSLGPLPDNFSF